MDAVEFLKQFNRMGKAYNDDGCKECPAYKYRCGEDFDEQEEDGVSIVGQWSKEHPIKTRQSEFLKMFPNASVGYNGTLVICPSQADTKAVAGCIRSERNCDKCKRDFWLAEIKDEEA